MKSFIMGTVRPPKKMIPAANERQFAKYCCKVVIVCRNRNKNTIRRLQKGSQKTCYWQPERKLLAVWCTVVDGCSLELPKVW